jgi:hypothetical protein
MTDEKIVEELEDEMDKEHFWIDVEVNKTTGTTMQTLSACNVDIYLRKAVQKAREVTHEKPQ